MTPSGVTCLGPMARPITSSSFAYVRSSVGLPHRRPRTRSRHGDDLLSVALNRLEHVVEAVPGQSDLEPGDPEAGKLGDPGSGGLEH